MHALLSTSVTSRAPTIHQRHFEGALATVGRMLYPERRQHPLRNPLSVVIIHTMECDPTLSLPSFRTSRRRVGIIK